MYQIQNLPPEEGEGEPRPLIVKIYIVCRDVNLVYFYEIQRYKSTLLKLFCQNLI